MAASEVIAVTRRRTRRFGLTGFDLLALFTANLVLVVGLWWRGGGLTGGAPVTSAGRLAGLLGAYLVLVQVLLLGDHRDPAARELLSSGHLRALVPAARATRRHHRSRTSAIGQAIEYQYGILQVKATLTNGRLSAVTLARFEPEPGRSRFIDAQAVPLLHAAVLQSAIDRARAA